MERATDAPVRSQVVRSAFWVAGAFRASRPGVEWAFLADAIHTFDTRKAFAMIVEFGVASATLGDCFGMAGGRWCCCHQSKSLLISL